MDNITESRTLKYSVLFSIMLIKKNGMTTKVILFYCLEFQGIYIILITCVGVVTEE